MDEVRASHKDINNSQVVIKVINIYNEFELVDRNFEEVFENYCDQVI